MWQPYRNCIRYGDSAALKCLWQHLANPIPQRELDQSRIKSESAVGSFFFPIEFSDRSKLQADDSMAQHITCLWMERAVNQHLVGRPSNSKRVLAGFTFHPSPCFIDAKQNFLKRGWGHRRTIGPTRNLPIGRVLEVSGGHAQFLNPLIDLHSNGLAIRGAIVNLGTFCSSWSHCFICPTSCVTGCL